MPNDAPDLRRLTRAVGWNAALWSIGNLLTTGGFLLYFVKSYSPPPFAVTVLLIVPETVGLAGLLTARCLALGISRPTLWWTGQLAARLLVALIPFVAGFAGRTAPTLAAWTIVALVGLSSLIHSLSFNALITWLAEMAPGTRWGQLFGRRQLFGVLALLLVAVPIALLRDTLSRTFPQIDRLFIFGPLFLIGVTLQLLALVPLWPFRHLGANLHPTTTAATAGLPSSADTLPHTLPATGATAGLPGSAVARPHEASPLPAILWRWCFANWWLAFFSGLSQSPLFTLRVDLLAISLSTWYLLEATLRTAQLPLYELAGRASDRGHDLRSMRWGIIATSLAVLVAVVATRETWALMFLTQLLFAGWAGVNVAGPNVTLRTVAPDQRDRAFAWFHNVSGLAAGLAGLAGGALVTTLATPPLSSESALRLVLALSFLGRLTTLLWLPKVSETYDS